MKNIINVEQLKKSYGSLKAVRGIDIVVDKGEVFGLLGANGAGKSTTIECILGTRTPDAGTVSILGLNPEADRKRLFERVGVQFQESNYQDRITVAELCEVTDSLYRSTRPYRELLVRFGLGEKRKSAIADLSGGQRQKLFIVLALIPDPEVVFLDELTTGLDTRSRREVWKCLKDMKEEGLTIFLTSHFMDEVEALCDRIAIMKAGRVVFSGTVAEALEGCPFDNFEDAYLYYAEEEYDNENI